MRAAINYHYEEVVKWLVLYGALSRRGVSIDDATMRNDLGRIPARYAYDFTGWGYDKRLNLLSWAQDAVIIHDNLQLFLLLCFVVIQIIITKQEANKCNYHAQYRHSL